ncbi:MAG: NYN domain-containing protein [Melioribacteraceae bacterium]
MKHYIIDGNNLIGRILELKKIHEQDKQQSREELVNLLNDYFAGKGIKLSLHFDGYKKSYLRIINGKIKYSKNLQADSMIRKEIDDAQSKRLITLVTSDLSLLEYARVNGCSIKTSEEFYNEIKNSYQINEEEERIKKLEKEKNEFLKIFGAE